jgi:hypothetical protein
MKGMAFSVVLAPKGRSFHRAGSHSVWTPMTICAPKSTVIASHTWVTPPVGSGRAGTNIRSRMVTAKLFAANTCERSPMVFGPSERSQSSSWVLKGWSTTTSASHHQRSYCADFNMWQRQRRGADRPDAPLGRAGHTRWT